MSNKQYKIMQTVTVVLFAVSLVVMVLAAVHVIVKWDVLYHKIPRAFSFWGEPDLNFAQYADRRPLVSRLVLGGILGVILAALAVYPKAWNLELQDIPKAARADVTAIVQMILSVFEFSSCVYFGTFIEAAVRGGKRFALTNLLLIILMAAAIVYGAILIVRTVKAAEAEEEEEAEEPEATDE